MVSLEPFELLDHHSTGRERALILVWNSTHQENLAKAPIRSRHLARISRGNGDEVVDHFPGALDALCWDAATISIPEEKATGFRKHGRISQLSPPPCPTGGAGRL